MILRTTNKALREDEHPKIAEAIRAAVESSRFRAKVSVSGHARYGHHVKIENIRLRRVKHYCGQHPDECVINPSFQKKERRGSRLEGSDWVGWNDRLNELLDRMGVSADVWSFNREALPAGSFYIRKGLCRRVDYESHEIYRAVVFHVWNRDGRHENWVGREAPRSACPEGTPGLACWTREEEASLASLAHVH